MDRLKIPKFVRRFAGWIRLAALLVGFGSAVVLRAAIGGHYVAQSTAAGLVFAGCLLLLSLFSWPHLTSTRRTVVSGLAGGVFLCLPALLFRLAGADAHPPSGNYLGWALMVGVVALAEELFLRGTLFDAVRSLRGDVWAIIVCALAFAALHIPLYGWRAVPLDVAVGLWLGALRTYSGSWVAPGIAHIAADLAAWFIR